MIFWFGLTKNYEPKSCAIALVEFRYFPEYQYLFQGRDGSESIREKGGISAATALKEENKRCQLTKILILIYIWFI